MFWKSRSAVRVWPGRPYPLGATWNGNGVNFALFSLNATRVELCMFDSVDSQEESYWTRHHVHNLSWNCGHEGPTENPEIHELRLRQLRNFFATLKSA